MIADDELAALVRPDSVNKRVYTDPAIFALEMERIYGRAWIYVGHDSQVPTTGDYHTTRLGDQDVVMVRAADGAVKVLYNRCPHKGAKLVSEGDGCAGKFFRCPYHAWTYRLDGAPLALPLKAGYEGTQLRQCESGRGMVALANVAVYRDFVFVRLSEAGPSFEDYFGDVLQAIDNLVDRSPEGRLVVAGGAMRNIIHCNWKMYLENINDTVHPMSTHESATQAASQLWEGHGPDDPKPMAMEQILPFGAGYDFFDRMGGRVFANGHSVLGVNFSIHSNYAQVPEYEAAMTAAHGAQRAADILQRTPQNAVLFPSLAAKGSPQAIRVIRPLAADRTLVEAWAFRPAGAPELLFERSLTYNRLVFSPMSIVAHDDVALFESMQQGLRADGNEWISLHRDHRAGEADTPVQTVNGTNEILMRNQFRAWAHFMTQGMEAAA